MTAKTSAFINRELSWLAFNRRVLGEALDTSLPLLERLKFLAITSSNLDEFFMVRVGGLQLLASQGSETSDPSGLKPAEQLAEIAECKAAPRSLYLNNNRDAFRPGKPKPKTETSGGAVNAKKPAKRPRFNIQLY